MVRADDDEQSGFGSVLGLAGVGEKGKLRVTRRWFLYGLLGGSITLGTVGAIVAVAVEGHRPLFPKVGPGPAATLTPGTLAGPRAQPIWSTKLLREINFVEPVGGVLIAVDDDGSVRGFDPRTGAEKWQPSAEFFFESKPLLVGDVLYGSDLDGHVLAVDTTTGAVRWQTQIASSGVDITKVQGFAGSLVFARGEADGQAGSAGYGVLWAVDTTAQKVAWNVTTANTDMAVVASEAAGVVLTATQLTSQLAAYSVKDGSALWHTTAPNAGSFGAPVAPEDCVAVSGSTFYWAADQLYALDAATGDAVWTGSSVNPADEFQDVIVLPGQGSGDGDLVVATATGPSGGTLHAFDAKSGTRLWTEHGDAKFGLNTELGAGKSVVCVAEQDNGSVVAVDARTGQTRWTFHDADADTDNDWRVAADDKQVYVVRNNILRAFAA